MQIHFIVSYIIPETIESKSIFNMVAISGIEPEPTANFFLYFISSTLICQFTSHITPHHLAITFTANTDNITSAIPYALFNTICHFCWLMIPFFIFSSSALKSINTSLSICSISPCIFLRLLPASLAFSNSFLPSVSICHTSCSVLLICFS